MSQCSQSVLVEKNSQQLPQVKSMPWKAGTIKSIKLINFMCHSAFELEFGSHVNFVIGPNGSGKSAILTALAVALGARATTTGRARKMEEFVKYGENFARIVITLHNYEKVFDKDQAYKPEDYGKFIVIEKTIVKDGVARLALRSDKRTVVSERTSELHEMLDHFNIQINNPICILTQEVSKTFLHSRKAEDKFNLFMEATSIKQVEDDYRQSESVFNQWVETNKSHEINSTLLESEYDSCLEKIKFIERRRTIEEDVIRLQILLIWAKIRDEEKSINNLQNKIVKNKADIESLQQEIDDRESKFSMHNGIVESLDSKLSERKENVGKIKDDLTKLRQKEYDLKIEKSNLETQIESCKRKCREYDLQRKELEEKIEQTKNKDSNPEELKRLIEQIEKELPELKAKQATINQHSNQLASSIRTLDTDVRVAETESSEKSRAVYQLETDLKRIENKQVDYLLAFGQNMGDLRARIDREHNFKHKPVGPLGFYIKMNDPDAAAALEACLGNGASAFTCDNNNDLARLKSIWPGQHPTIISREFGPKHDAQRYKVNHHKYKCLLDCITVENDAVFNVLLDKYSIDNVLFIPNYEEAQNFMLNPSGIPASTKAYTSEGHHMFPVTSRGGYRSYANDRTRHYFSKNDDSLVKRLRFDINAKKVELRVAKEKFAKVTDSLRAQRQEYDNNMKELRRIGLDIRAKEDESLKLRTSLELDMGQPIEIKMYEEEIASMIKSTRTEMQKKADAEKRLEELGQELKETELECQECKRSFDKLQKEIQQISENKKNSEDIMKAAKEFINESQSSMRKKNALIKTLNEQVKTAVETIERSRAAHQSGDKPSNIPPTVEVETDLKTAINFQQVELEDMQDPTKTMDRLVKRMNEIETFKQQREMNLENTEAMKKALAERDRGFKAMRQITFSKVSTSFSSIMQSMNMQGVLDICYDNIQVDGQLTQKEKTLHIRVNTHSNDLSPETKKLKTQENRDTLDTRSLSGGERSFSTVAFVLALWHHCVSPFKLMDEIDVFMDMVTRRQSYNALVSFANIADDPGQFIFFSPLGIPKISNPENIKVFEMPEIVRKAD